MKDGDKENQIIVTLDIVVKLITGWRKKGRRWRWKEVDEQKELKEGENEEEGVIKGIRGGENEEEVDEQKELEEEKNEEEEVEEGIRGRDK